MLSHTSILCVICVLWWWLKLIKILIVKCRKTVWRPGHGGNNSERLEEKEEQL